MKFKNLITMAMFLVSTVTFGQDIRPIEVESNKIVNIPADQAWVMVQDWKNLHQLAPTVVESTTVQGEGLHSSWDINLVNGGFITEKMVYFNESEKTLSYIMTETPMPIEAYVAIIKVEQYGIRKSLISFYTECKTSTQNYDNIKSTFKEFQETYLANIKNRNNE